MNKLKTLFINLFSHKRYNFSIVSLPAIFMVLCFILPFTGLLLNKVNFSKLHFLFFVFIVVAIGLMVLKWSPELPFKFKFFNVVVLNLFCFAMWIFYIPLNLTPQSWSLPVGFSLGLMASYLGDSYKVRFLLFAFGVQAIFSSFSIIYLRLNVIYPSGANSQLEIQIFKLLIAILISSLATLATFWLSSIYQRLHDEESLKIYNHILEEKLNFAADLHDLQGRQFQLIILKSRLIKEKTKFQPALYNQFSEIEAVAVSTLQEIREYVYSLRELEFENEFNQGIELLEKLGVEVENKTTVIPPREVEQKSVIELLSEIISLLAGYKEAKLTISSSITKDEKIIFKFTLSSPKKINMPNFSLSKIKVKIDEEINIVLNPEKGEVILIFPIA